MNSFLPRIVVSEKKVLYRWMCKIFDNCWNLNLTWGHVQIIISFHLLTILDKRHTSWSFGSFYRCLRRIPSLVSTYWILPQRFTSRYSRRRWPSTRMELPKLTRPRSSQGTYICPLGNGILQSMTCDLFWLAQLATPQPKSRPQLQPRTTLLYRST